MENKMWCYDKKCKRCGHLEIYVLTSSVANPGINVEHALQSLEEDHSADWNYCENCKRVTKQEVVSYWEDEDPNLLTPIPSGGGKEE